MTRLMDVFSGWDGYNTSLIRAIAPRTMEQLAFRLPTHHRSVGEVAAHLAIGRIDWFNRMGAPGSAELWEQAKPAWGRGINVDSSVTENAGEIVKWLELSWGMIEGCLNQWTVSDLFDTYRFEYQGQEYAIPRQWTIWRIMSHDVHHGGQLTILLGAQGIDLPELADNHGHIIEPPLAAD
jgi:uncharacterized damage-inducible protein DinB